MATRRTWIFLGVLAAALVVLLAAAGAAVYFVTRHVQTKQTSAGEALRELDRVRTSFADARPLYELDEDNEPHAVRPLRDLPTSALSPTSLEILAWDPSDQRTVRLSLPFWVMRLGRSKVSVVDEDPGFSLDRLDLNVDELARIGPALVLDYRSDEGVRILLWTE